MNSVYYTDKSLQVFYDLKGSELGRAAKKGQDVLKDNDLRRTLPNESFSFHPDVRERVRQQIVSDCQFLRNMQIMDYSMLIGVHHVPPKQGDKSKSVAETGFRISGLKERQVSHRGPKRRGSQSAAPPSAVATTAAKAEGINSFFHPGLDSENNENKSGNGKVDPSKKLNKDVRESTSGFKNSEFAGLLDEEDDCSYLEGSAPFSKHDSALNLARYQQHPSYDDVELKKEQTIEQIYWPFHRFYDINGLRRMKPKACFRCNQHPCICEGHVQLTKAWKIPAFQAPLSNRKDGGLMMDTSGLFTPMTFTGPNGNYPYEGKIFYMGIIDILQQYNERKRVETSYRKMENIGNLQPSCVSPDDYADRFVAFFDEYSEKAIQKPPHVDDTTEIETTIIDKEVINSVHVDVKQSLHGNGNKEA
jgi:1-phosphatidylinositol-4-phosphate 5-kinase